MSLITYNNKRGTIKLNDNHIKLLFIWWINKIRELGDKKIYDFSIEKVKFDVQNIPVNSFYKRESLTHHDHSIETKIDFKPSLNSYIEMLPYDENGNFVKEITDEISKYIINSEGFKEFQKLISDKWDFFDGEDERKYEVTYVLESLFIAVLQNYSDRKDGIFSIFKEELDYEFLNELLDNYLGFFNKKYCEVELIIPIVGAIWIKNKSEKDLFEKIEENMAIRLTTKNEQEGRIYFSKTQLGIFEAEKDFFESKHNIYKSNLVISIKEKVYVKDLLNSDHKTINKIYEKYHLKVNTILNLISLNVFEYNLNVRDIYYKCDFYPFSYYATPETSWKKIRTLSRSVIELSTRNFFHQPLELNSELVQKILISYLNILRANSGNGDRVQGAFLRRTRAEMDLNETEGLLDSIIGIEQLFSSGQSAELTFRISLYVCNILYKSEGFEDQSKKSIFNEFRDLYKLRSSFVHTGKKVSNERGLFYLTSLLKQVIDSDKINLKLNESISEQTQNTYLF